MTLSELYQDAARVAKMIEGTILTMAECTKLRGNILGRGSISLGFDPDDYELALAIVEGKPVFANDILWTNSGFSFQAGKHVNFENCSWNPPKPKTVLVKMLREDAVYYSSMDSFCASEINNRFYKTCRKALLEDTK